VRVALTLLLVLFLATPSPADESSILRFFKNFSPKAVKRVLSRLEDKEVVGGSRLSNRVFAVYPSLTVYPYPEWGVIVTTPRGWIKKVVIRQDGKEVFRKDFSFSDKKVRLVELPPLKPGFYEIEVVLSQLEGKSVVNIRETENFEVVELPPELQAKLKEFEKELKARNLAPCDRYLAWATFFEELNLKDDEYDFTYNRDYLLNLYKACKNH